MNPAVPPMNVLPSVRRTSDQAGITYSKNGLRAKVTLHVLIFCSQLGLIVTTLVHMARNVEVPEWFVIVNIVIASILLLEMVFYFMENYAYFGDLKGPIWQCPVQLDAAILTVCVWSLVKTYAVEGARFSNKDQLTYYFVRMIRDAYRFFRAVWLSRFLLDNNIRTRDIRAISVEAAPAKEKQFTLMPVADLHTVFCCPWCCRDRLEEGISQGILRSQGTRTPKHQAMSPMSPAALYEQNIDRWRSDVNNEIDAEALRGNTRGVKLANHRSEPRLIGEWTKNGGLRLGPTPIEEDERQPEEETSRLRSAVRVTYRSVDRTSEETPTTSSGRMKRRSKKSNEQNISKNKSKFFSWFPFNRNKDQRQRSTRAGRIDSWISITPSIAGGPDSSTPNIDGTGTDSYSKVTFDSSRGLQVKDHVKEVHLRAVPGGRVEIPQGMWKPRRGAPIKHISLPGGHYTMPNGVNSTPHSTPTGRGSDILPNVSPHLSPVVNVGDPTPGAIWSWNIAQNNAAQGFACRSTAAKLLGLVSPASYVRSPCEPGAYYNEQIEIDFSNCTTSPELANLNHIAVKG